MEQQRFVRKNTAMFDAQRRQEKKRSRRTVFYVFLFLFVSLIFLAVCVAVFLKIKTVNINGNSRYSYEQIRELVNITEGENIYSFDSKENENAIMRALPYIGSVEINRDLPTTVDINIIEEEPYFAAELAGDTYLLSSNLKVLEKIADNETDTSGLTVLKLNNVQRCIVGEYIEFVDGRTFDAIFDLYECFVANDIEDKIIAVDVRSRFDIYIDYEGRFDVYVGDMENINIKIKFLVGIIDELYEDSTGTIDISDPREAAVALS